MEELHQPVLWSEVLEVLQPRPGETYLDLTAGYAGHASKILAATRTHKNSTLVDRDENAIKYLREKFDGEPIEILHKSFCEAVLRKIECGNTYDMILADFGVSSPQLDRPERGFSFTEDGPLDMRMDTRQGLTAERIVNKWRERDLVKIFVEYGEVQPRYAARVAQMIVRGRPWQDTQTLADAIAKLGRRGKHHPATQIFQAIRIAVNDELGQIERTLPLLPKLLKPGGRIALITFHSLEDRLVKNYLREAASRGAESELVILTKKPIVAGEQELFINPRARSAKLRVARRA